jgi:hypothetical protein
MPSTLSGDVRAHFTLFRKPYNEDTGKSISGIATKAGNPYPRARVWLIDRRTGLLVAATSADASGHYVFRSVTDLPGDTEGYIVLGFDDSKTYDPEAKDFIQPEADA